MLVVTKLVLARIQEAKDRRGRVIGRVPVYRTQHEWKTWAEATEQERRKKR